MTQVDDNVGATISEIIELTDDNGVTKETLTTSENDKTPWNGCEVLLNYSGRLTDGTVFDTSYDKDAKRVVVGTGQVLRGWDIALMSMKLGERAEFTLAPEYAYGKCGSPPGIPDNSTVIFDIELLEIYERRPTRWMTSDGELVMLAERKKALGNESYKQKEYKEAILHYHDALAYS